MSVSAFAAAVPETPAFVYDEGAILDRLATLAAIREQGGARLLYSIKAFPFFSLLEALAPRLDGLAASGLFEARLAAEALAGGGGSLHLTSPGLRADEMGELAGLCSHIAFNSLEQFRRLAPLSVGRASLGLRVNPGLSFLADSRYDPCRPGSKLGVPVAELAAALAEDAALARAVDGLHFHTAYESASLAPLRAVLARLAEALGGRLDRLRWLDLGGGYRLEDAAAVLELSEIVREVSGRCGLEVFIEPGKALVGAGGYLVASVLDRFRRDGKTILVLDTGVQHLPEVFEYQRPPEVAGHRPEGGFAAVLAGCTCVAGDVFGEYRFEEPLEVGERVVFRNVGAYGLVKASRFNGFDLPAVYALDREGGLRCLKRYGYASFRSQWRADTDALAGGPDRI